MVTKRREVARQIVRAEIESDARCDRMPETERAGRRRRDVLYVMVGGWANQRTGWTNEPVNLLPRDRPACCCNRDWRAGSRE